MKRAPAVLVFLMLIALPASAGEQRARAILDSSLAALGGRAHIESFASWEVVGSGRENLSAEVQGLAPDVPTWRPHQEQVTVDARSMAVAWQPSSAMATLRYGTRHAP